MGSVVRLHLVAVGLVVAVVAAGCSSGGNHAPAPTTAAAPVVTTTSVTATTSTTVGVDQIPPVITVEYAQSVMNALDKLEGDVTRLLVAKRVPTLEFKQMLTALYDEPGYSRAEASYGREAAHELEDYVQNPGNPVTKVKRVLDASSACMVLDSDRDFGPQLRDQP